MNLKIVRSRFFFLLFIICFSLSLLLVLCSCGGYFYSKSEGVAFENFDELKAMFTDAALYPSYFPKGFDFIEENLDSTHVSIGAGFDDVRRNRKDWERDDFTGYSIRVYSRESNEGKDWVLAAVSVGSQIVSDYYWRQRILERFIKLEHDSYIVYKLEEYNVTMLRGDEQYNDRTDFLYAQFYLTYIFFSEDQLFQPYSVSFNYDIYIQDLDESLKEQHRLQSMEEATKIYESLVPYR